MQSLSVEALEYTCSKYRISQVPAHPKQRYGQACIAPQFDKEIRFLNSTEAGKGAGFKSGRTSLVDFSARVDVREWLPSCLLEVDGSQGSHLRVSAKWGMIIFDRGLAGPPVFAAILPNA
jgi:hypothetical protein